MKVGIIIGAALGDVDDVVDLKVGAYVAAMLAGVLVTQEDGFALTAPGATTPA